jgi:mono/diheme cytochrome c family protein
LVVVAGCGGGEEASPAPETVVGTIPQETAPNLSGGDAAAGKEIFTTTASPACASCHTFQAAGSTGQVGPNLDEGLKGKDAQFIYESIVDPDAEIASGFNAGVMPTTYGESLDDKQLADLVAFLTPKS